MDMPDNIPNWNDLITYEVVPAPPCPTPAAMTPLTRKITYAVTFESLGILLASGLLLIMTGEKRRG